MTIRGSLKSASNMSLQLGISQNFFGQVLFMTFGSHDRISAAFVYQLNGFTKLCQ